MDKVTKTYPANGKEYVLSELSYADWQSLAKYMQYRPYYQMKKDAQDIPELESLLPETLKECANNKVSLMDIDGKDFGPDIVTEMVYLSLRKYHQSISREDVDGLVSLKNQEELLTIVMELSGIPEGDDNPNPTKAVEANQ